jgi:hypothetical protein
MPFDPATLSGPLALWKLDEGSGSIAKNAFGGSTNPGTNLLYAPEQAFNQSGVGWAAAYGTDYYANNPDGHATASRLQFPSGEQYCSLLVSLGANTYTYSIYAKSNDGSNHDLRLARYDAGGFTYSSPTTITSAGGWQRITWTFTATGTLYYVYVANDGTNAADVLVWGAQLEVGSSASSYFRPQMDLVLNHAASPTWDASGLANAAGNFACAVNNTPVTFTAVTVYVAVKQASTGTYNFIFADINPYMCTVLAGNNGQGVWIHGVGGTDSTIPSLLDSSWHVLASSWDGTTLRNYIDGTLMLEVTGVASWASHGFVLGAAASNFVGKYGAAAVYTAGHSASDVQAMTTYMQGLLTGHGETAENLSAFVLFEGDSISALANGSMLPQDTMAAVTPVTQWTDTAVGGSTISSLVSRETGDNLRLSPTKTHPILFVFAGTNDIAGGHNAATTFADLKAYCLAMRTAGWTIVVGTILPRAQDASFETIRLAVNTSIRGDTSFYDALADFGSDATMGDIATTGNTTYYDALGIHPTPLGDTLLAPYATAAIEAAFSTALGMAQDAAATSITISGADLSVGVATGGTSPYTYQWYRSTSSGFTPGGGNILSGKTSRSFTDSGLTPATNYYYVCRATDNASATADSNEVHVLTLPAIQGVVTLSGSPVSGATVILVDRTDGTVATTTTASDGSYSFTVVSGKTYHASVEYTSGGIKYNAPSEPFLVP